MIHVYTGEGKGKTTAAIGLAVRAAGVGVPVLFCQFMKGGETGELKSLELIKNIKIIRCQEEYPFFNSMSDDDKRKIRKEHNSIISSILNEFIFVCYEKKANSNSNDEERDDELKGVVILDEITYPMAFDLIDCDMVYSLLECLKINVELVCTGRNPSDRLLEMADYITDMKALKHPFEKGVGARVGIEY